MIFVTDELRKTGPAPILLCRCPCGHQWLAPMWPDPMCPECNPGPETLVNLDGLLSDGAP